MKLIGLYTLVVFSSVLTCFSKDKNKQYCLPQEDSLTAREQIFCEPFIPNSFAFQLHISKGIYRMQEKSYERAISNFEQALFLNPGSFEAYSLLGEAFLALGLKSEALKAFDSAIELNPFYAIAYFHRSNLFHETGDYRQACQDYAIAAYINPVYRKALGDKEKDLTYKRVLKNELKTSRK